MQFFGQINDTGNMECSRLLDHVNAGFAMPSAANEDNIWVHSPTLLGILIKRASRISATDKSILGQ